MTPQELKICRKALGLTVADLAEQFKVNRRTVQRWEFNNTPPTEVEEWVKARLDYYEKRVEGIVVTAEYDGEATLIRYGTNEECIPTTGLTVREHDALLTQCVTALNAADLPYRIIAKPES